MQGEKPTEVKTVTYRIVAAHVEVQKIRRENIQAIVAMGEGLMDNLKQKFWQKFSLV